MRRARQALVIGGGPAGLMAAGRLLRAGHPTILCEALPTVGRKFLMAGRGGLNLTKQESLEDFSNAYGDAKPWLMPSLSFGPAEIRDWVHDLGQQTFVGTSGRVFPVAMKASPLLRAWLLRLRGLGLDLRTGWRWVGSAGDRLVFNTPSGGAEVVPDVCVLALGGASWPRLGSDGAWTDHLALSGVPIAPFRPANMGFHINWTDRMTRFLGSPVKPLGLRAGDQTIRGEVVISRHGLEGGGLYAVSAALREGVKLSLDLIPDIPFARAQARLSARNPRESAVQALRKGLGLDPVRLAVAMEFGRPWPTDPSGRAALAKSLPVPLGSPMPLERAISSAGGIMASGLTRDLMLVVLPGVFVAGEMLDWEAPTGGYLLTACLATGRLAGDAAARWLER